MVCTQKASNGLRKLRGIDRENCAKSCMDEELFSCEAFDYCKNKKDQE